MSARRTIIAALSEDKSGIATLSDVERAEQLADSLTTEVRREDAALIEEAACDADWSATPAYCQGLRAGAELLLAKTTEKTTAPAAAPFFQPGHTYTREWVGQRIDFLVRHIDTDPDNGRRVAFGWRRFADTGWEPANSDDLNGWTDVAEVSAG